MSDNPVMFYNQYMENFRGASCTGLASLGLQLFLPLSSRVMLHFYDPNIYRIRTNNSNVCEVSNDAETLKFNELQWLNARENVYYSSQAKPISISSQAQRFLKNHSDNIPMVREYPIGGTKHGSLFLNRISEQGFGLVLSALKRQRKNCSIRSNGPRCAIGRL